MRETITGLDAVKTASLFIRQGGILHPRHGGLDDWQRDIE